MVAFAVLATVPVAVSRVDLAHRISVAQQPWTTSVDTVDGPALVIVASAGEYLLFSNPVSRNGPELDDDLLYALDLGPQNFDTLAAHPDRTPYLQVASAHPDELAPRESPITPTVEVLPIEVVDAPTLTVRTTFTPLDGAPVVVPFVEIGGEITWGSASDLTVDADGAVHVARLIDGSDVAPEGTTVRFGFGAGSDAAAARSTPRIRWEVTARRAGSGVQALVPAQQFVRFPVGKDWRWYPRPGYPGAAVEVSAGG